VQNYLVAEWLRTTNFFLPKIDCDTFIENRENNVPMLILFDDWDNLKQGKRSYNANLAYIYDKETFPGAPFNFFLFDMSAFENQQCLGEWGLPEETDINSVNYYYYMHQDIEPIKLFETIHVV